MGNGPWCLQNCLVIDSLHSVTNLSDLTSRQRQTQDFGHDHSSEYSSLIFDNRGMGESDKPIARYSTSEMAKDAFDLLNYLGWTSKRQLHIIGVSMGGMIAQEMVRVTSA